MIMKLVLFGFSAFWRFGVFFAPLRANRRYLRITALSREKEK